MSTKTKKERELDALTMAIYKLTDLDDVASRDLAKRVQTIVDYTRGTQ